MPRGAPVGRILETVFNSGKGVLEMPAKDVDSGGEEHRVIVRPTGRRKYPFKVMEVGDWLLVESGSEAMAIRHAIRSHARRLPGRKFSVRQRMDRDDQWICRRVA